MAELFGFSGIHCVVDGQFGSTGKGVLAAWLAEQAVLRGVKFQGVISNAGPNSGHTFYDGNTKHVLKQLPTFAVASYLIGESIPVFLSGGAVIDPEILTDEAICYPGIEIWVHPAAVVVDQSDKSAEHSGSVAAVAGTRSGTGAAIARKVLRDPSAVFGAYFLDNFLPANIKMGWPIGAAQVMEFPYFMEISQGFSLGINQGFYPKTTSRECTVSQGLADAGLPPHSIEKVYLSMRTFPIRVGNVDGYDSGGGYSDQREINWSDIGVEPELTTVTKRPRRIFTWSDTQALAAMMANQPDFVFLNFMNYLKDEEQGPFLERVDKLIKQLPLDGVEIIQCVGPKSEHVLW